MFNWGNIKNICFLNRPWIYCTLVQHSTKNWLLNIFEIDCTNVPLRSFLLDDNSINLFSRGRIQWIYVHIYSNLWHIVTSTSKNDLQSIWYAYSPILLILYFGKKRPYKFPYVWMGSWNDELLSCILLEILRLIRTLQWVLNVGCLTRKADAEFIKWLIKRWKTPRSILFLAGHLNKIVGSW